MIHIDNVSDQLKTIPLACVDLATMEQADGALSDLADFSKNLVDINGDTLASKGTNILIVNRKKLNV